MNEPKPTNPESPDALREKAATQLGMVDMFKAANRLGPDSLAFTPEQAWSLIAALVPEMVTREHVQQLVTLIWRAAVSAPGRAARHEASITIPFPKPPTK
jgi:hypothetical protein